MEIVYKGIGEIRPYENNPRKNDGSVDAVAASIREFGWSALEKSWSAIAFLPVLSAIAETVIEAVITPVSKRVAYSVKRQQMKDGIR